MWGKSILTFLLVVAYSCPGIGQNLVSNPGFEEYNNCPQGLFSIPPQGAYDSFNSVKYWVSGTVGTPDYFNICATDTLAVPCNFFDCQYPHSGNGYVGLGMISRNINQITGSREYIETKLNNNLIAGHNYYISMHLNLTTPYSFVTRSVIAADRIGIHFSDTQVSAYVLYLSLPAQFHTPVGEYITDTSNWTKIEGTFTATGSEQWMTIGRFFDSSETDSIIYLDNTGVYMCYMYIDDVCVRDMDASSSDTLLCVEGFPATISGKLAGDKYLWSTGETTATITVGKPGTYWRRVTGECLYYTDTIRVLPKPALNLGNDTLVCNSTRLVLNTLEQGLQYNWSTGEHGCCVIPQSSGTYTLEAYNACGTATDEIEVAFSNCTDCIRLPTAFSPNADGKNDGFGPLHRCPTDYSFYSFKIFDRWGKIVFATSDPNKKWDGRYKGVQQNVDVYNYLLQYSSPLQNTSDIVTVKGNVTLMR